MDTVSPPLESKIYESFIVSKAFEGHEGFLE